MAQNDELREYFFNKINELSEQHPEEAEKLKGKILEYASAIAASRFTLDNITPWYIIGSQIKDKAVVSNTPPEKIIDLIFEAETADGIMLYIQI